MNDTDFIKKITEKSKLPLEVSPNDLQIKISPEKPMEPEHARKSTTNEERYVHVRLPDDVSSSHATIFARKEDDGVWYVGASLCSRLDQFCRRTGRHVARRRYFQGRRAQFEGDWAEGHAEDNAMKALELLATDVAK